MRIIRSHVEFEEERTVTEVILEVDKPGQYKIRADIRGVTNTYFSVEKVEDGPS